MIARVAHVITCASACRCFEASERTSASASLAVASIRSVILVPSQVAIRVSRIVPITISTISRPLPRAHKETPVSSRTVRNITLHHSSGQPGADMLADLLGWEDLRMEHVLDTQVSRLLSHALGYLRPRLLGLDEATAR